MMLSQVLEQAAQRPGISEWLHGLGDLGVALMLIYFRWSAKRDTQQRHRDNKTANEETQNKQDKILQELQAERDYLPQHWHGEIGAGRTLTTDGIIRRPKNGT